MAASDLTGATETQFGMFGVFMNIGFGLFGFKDLDLSARLPEARRSQRGKNAYSEISREAYMMWVNRKAVG